VAYPSAQIEHTDHGPGRRTVTVTERGERPVRYEIAPHPHGGVQMTSGRQTTFHPNVAEAMKEVHQFHSSGTPSPWNEAQTAFTHPGPGKWEHVHGTAEASVRTPTGAAVPPHVAASREATQRAAAATNHAARHDTVEAHGTAADAHSHAAQLARRAGNKDLARRHMDQASAHNIAMLNAPHEHKAPGIVQRGKKGGEFVVSRTGKKEYVGKGGKKKGR